MAMVLKSTVSISMLITVELLTASTNVGVGWDQLVQVVQLVLIRSVFAQRIRCGKFLGGNQDYEHVVTERICNM